MTEIAFPLGKLSGALGNLSGGSVKLSGVPVRPTLSTPKLCVGVCVRVSDGSCQVTTSQGGNN